LRCDGDHSQRPRNRVNSINGWSVLRPESKEGWVAKKR
jgi:hypothetical protein